MTSPAVRFHATQCTHYARAIAYRAAEPAETVIRAVESDVHTSPRSGQQRPPASLRIAHASGFFINTILLIVSRYTAETAFQRQRAIVRRSQRRAAFIALAFVYAIFIIHRAHERAAQAGYGALRFAQHRAASQHYAMLQPVAVYVREADVLRDAFERGVGVEIAVGHFFSAFQKYTQPGAL